MHTFFPKNFFFPQKTIYQVNGVETLPLEVRPFGERGLIVHGSSLLESGRLDAIMQHFSKENVTTFCRPKGEPTLTELSAVISEARKNNAEWIAGIGGGSALDSAKAAAGLFHAQHEPQHYQEGGVLEKTGIPFIAVPTTAGTGSEATSNSVIINAQKKVKLSIRDKSFLARTVILDGALLQDIPRAVLCYSAMDAYVQSYEAFISKNSTWISEVLALKGLELVNNHIESAFHTKNTADLSGLLLGSYFAGIAFASARLGVIHGIAHPLGALYGEPHGLICAACFLSSIKINQPVIEHKYERLSDAVDQDFQTRIKDLLELFSISSPFKNKPIVEREKIITATLSSGSTAANPKEITAHDVEQILDDIF